VPPPPLHHLCQQAGTSTERQLILIDRNRDLHIVPVMARAVAKLASMVDSAHWHDSTGMLSALVDHKLVGGSVCEWGWVCGCGLA